MKKSLIYIISISCCLFFVLSCERGLLDDMPLDKISNTDIFKDSSRVDNYVMGLYTYLPGVYNRFNGEAMLSSATDESTQCLSSFELKAFNDASLQPTSHPDQIWASAYEGIWMCNNLFENIGALYASTSQLKKEIFVNETRFIRAFLYFELVKRYAGVPLLKNTCSFDDDPNVPRDSFADCVEFIVNECDSIIHSALPEIQPESQMGRASRVAAKALKSRVLLYAASPLYNGPSIEGLNDPILGYGVYDMTRWEAAAQASSELLASYPTVIALYTSGATPQLKYSKLFYTPASNKELLFVKTRQKDNNVEKINAPVGYTNARGGVSPSQNLVDAYEMINGGDVNPDNPYSGRDPRFSASIQYNGALWWSNRRIETFLGGLDAQDASVNATKTGYYLRKFSDPAAVIYGTEVTALHYFPYFRVGEILLNYAEAMNEAYGPEVDHYGNGRTAKWAVDELRKRVDMPILSVGLTYNLMKEKIIHERQIELAFEEHRHWDLRRWKLAETELNKPLRKVIITKTNDISIPYSYEYSVLENRTFLPKMYLYPIHSGEILKNRSLRQNPLW